MKNVFMAALMGLSFIGCYGDKVTVEPGQVGKIMTKDGLGQEIKKPSSFRLPYSFRFPPKLIVADCTDKDVNETIRLMMPKDNLNLTFDVRGVYSTSSDPGRVNKIFDRLRTDGDGTTQLISFEKVYNTYAVEVVRSRSRQVVAKYSINDVLNNREAISAEIRTAIIDGLAATPIDVLQVGLADIQPPTIIVDAQEAAKTREIEIQRAEADRLVRMTQADADLAVAKKQQEIDLVMAETQMLVDKKLAEGVSEAFVTQRALNILDAMSRSNNKVFFLPLEAMGNPSLLLPATQNSLTR